MVMGMAMEMEMLFLLRLGHFRCLAAVLPAVCCLLHFSWLLLLLLLCVT